MTGGRWDVKARRWGSGIGATSGILLILWLSLFLCAWGQSAALLRDDHPEFGGWMTYVESPGIGRIAVHIRTPDVPRYHDGAPVIVNVSGFFTASSGFNFQWDPDALGAIYITYLWPGKTDARTGIRSDGDFDYGGPDCLTALRSVIRFATGEIPNENGDFLHDLFDGLPLYDVSGLYAFSHSGIAATNVMALHGASFPKMGFFVGRENPTLDALYPLEPGHWDEDTGRAQHNPFYDPAGYTPTSIAIDYSTVSWSSDLSRPVFLSPQNGQIVYRCSTKHPRMWEKDYWSTGLLQALLDNGALTRETWPETLATPEEAAAHWPFRTTVNNYSRLPDVLPHLKTMLVFAAADHVQTALDKPHIHHAYDGFHTTAGLWCRLNPDRAYVRAFSSVDAETVVPDNAANTEPSTWAVIRDWGYRTPPRSLHQQVVLAAIAEMCDRHVNGIWSNDLDAVLHAYGLSAGQGEEMAMVVFPDGTHVMASPLSARSEDNEARDFGLYMDAAWAPTWDAVVIDWPDFGLPAQPERAAAQIREAYERAKAGERLEIGCIGGTGRTGTVLACMAVLAGIAADEAVDWVRDAYKREAVETDDQERWVHWFAEFVRD